MTTTTEPTLVNGINTEALRGAIEAVSANPDNGQTHWQVASHWRGGARSDTQVTSYGIGGQTVKKDFTIRIDEPLELCGTNQFANPQEHLLAALNACMIVTYVAYCALEGITLTTLRIETEGDIDLRGLFGLDPSVPAGYDELRYTVHIAGDATPEQFERIHQTVMATSPNYFNVRNPIPLHARLVVE
ncbi:MAG: OsmC family protein [Terrimicrobiaceae bacterium]